MERRSLGGAGFDVSTLALGTMMFGAWGNPDIAECTEMVDVALDAGITTFDTADIYDFGRSEEILGEALRGRRAGVRIATKFGNMMGDDPSRRGGSARWVRQAVDDSLRRLQIDHIDLYQMHRPDPDVDISETLGALDELVIAGKVGAVGTSCFPPELIVESHWAAERQGVNAPRCEQPPYSVFCRGVERAVLPTCRKYGMGVMVWAPLNGGWLTGKYRDTAEAPDGSRAQRQPHHFDHGGPWRARKMDLVEQLASIADHAGVSLTGLALGFVLAHPSVSAALIGPRTPAQLRDLITAGQTRLDDATLAAIDAAVAPGTDINPADAGYTPAALDPTRLRA